MEKKRIALITTMILLSPAYCYWVLHPEVVVKISDIVTHSVTPWYAHEKMEDALTDIEDENGRHINFGYYMRLQSSYFGTKVEGTSMTRTFATDDAAYVVTYYVGFKDTIEIVKIPKKDMWDQAYRTSI